MPDLRQVVLLNYKQSVDNKKIDPESIPTLVPASALKEFQKDDPDPYYKTQKIEFPILVNGLNYQESFFTSFISKLNERPIPGSKSGHNIFDGERPPTDFLLIGAKIENKSKGKGFVYFKNYIPKTGATTPNETFIKENKSDMVHFSLVTYPKYEVTEDKDGNEEVNIIESLYGERNDAVEHNLGAMKQETNTIDQKDLKDKKMGGGNLEENKQELFKVLKNMVVNGQLNLSEIADAVSLQNQLITEEHTQAVKIVNSLKELGFTDPVKDYEKLKNKIEADREAVRNARLDKEFGTKEDLQTKKDNLLRTYADGKTENVFGEDLEKAINDLKEDPIAKRFATERADVNSEANELGVVENTNTENKPETKNGIRLVKV